MSEQQLTPCFSSPHYSPNHQVTLLFPAANVEQAAMCSFNLRNACLSGSQVGAGCVARLKTSRLLVNVNFCMLGELTRNAATTDGTLEKKNTLHLFTMQINSFNIC